MAKYVYVTPEAAKCTAKTQASYAKCLKRTLPQRAPIEAPGKVLIASSKDLIQVGTAPGIGPCGNPKDCKTKLDFPTPAQVLQAGLPVGTVAVMQQCVKAGKGNPMVPVTSLVQALEVSKEFCGCVGKSKGAGTRKKCAKRAA